MSFKMKIIQPTGSLDGPQAKHLSQEVENLVKVGDNLILVDLQQVTFVDSSGLGGLVSAFKKVRDAKGRLALCSVNAQARMVLELTRTDQLFEIFPDQAAFEQSLQTSELSQAAC